MRIPLDYYRILGLPLAASNEQLRQAYSDRIVQLPRREYSIAAISSRKQLIEEAYVVLSDADQRTTYDQLYLAHAYHADRSVANVIPSETSHLDQDTKSLNIEITPDQFVGSLLILQELGEYELVLKLSHPFLVNRRGALDIDKLSDHPDDLPDIILTVALSCLELGREQWQQTHYENAALSLETGAELLLRERLFANVQTEIALDLYKLRPYRILELIALPLEKTAERHQGLELLQSVLEDRGGIDGVGNDQSGLNIDEFLRFIQQLRNHLTVAEQHKLFEAQSQRPSAVSNYLTIYALIARGFTQRQPALIRQAKQMLIQLGKRQDVHLEQSLCALLLGQTEEATSVLGLSQEYEALATIRERSQDSPDLLPGLCLYTEQWLQKEVFAHFRDLVREQASLKDYFADAQVQAYLESLPTDAEVTNEWHSVNHQSFPQLQPREQIGVTPPFNYIPETEIRETSTADQYYQTPEIPVAKRPPARTTQRPQVKSQRHSPRRRNLSNSKTRLVWVIFASLMGLLVFWLLVSIIFSWLQTLFFPGTNLRGEQLAIQINKPPLLIPDANQGRSPLINDGALTNETAYAVIQTWLSTKAAALGPSHETSNLDQILTGAALSQWQLVIQQDIADNRYRLYSHSLQIELVNNIGTEQNQSLVEATVKELTNFYKNGQKETSSQEDLRVKYNLVRVDGRWRIAKMSVE